MFKVLILAALVAVAAAQFTSVNVTMTNNPNQISFPAGYGVLNVVGIVNYAQICDCFNGNVTGLCAPSPPIKPPTAIPSPVPAPHNPCSDIAASVSSTDVATCLTAMGNLQLATLLCHDGLVGLGAKFLIANATCNTYNANCDKVFINTSCTYNSANPSHPITGAGGAATITCGAGGYTVPQFTIAAAYAQSQCVGVTGKSACCTATNTNNCASAPPPATTAAPATTSAPATSGAPPATSAAPPASTGAPIATTSAPVPPATRAGVERVVASFAVVAVVVAAL